MEAFVCYMSTRRAKRRPLLILHNLKHGGQLLPATQPQALPLWWSAMPQVCMNTKFFSEFGYFLSPGYPIDPLINIFSCWIGPGSGNNTVDNGGLQQQKRATSPLSSPTKLKTTQQTTTSSSFSSPSSPFHNNQLNNQHHHNIQQHNQSQQR